MNDVGLDIVLAKQAREPEAVAPRLEGDADPPPTRPARRDSSRQRSINLNSCSGSGASFFSGSRAKPGARAATSQLDWLISMTTINVLSGSRTARDLLRSTGLGMERSIVGITTAMVHYSRRPPHSISPREERGEERRAIFSDARDYVVAHDDAL